MGVLATSTELIRWGNQLIHYRQCSRLSEAFIARQQLMSLETLYPGFDTWFVNRVIPGIVAGADPMFIAEDAGSLVGIAIGKIGTQPKLRCVRVLPPYQNRGIGLHLIDRTLARLGADSPITTVAEEMVMTWARILTNRYGFALTHVHKGLYRPGKLEFVYNDTALLKSSFSVVQKSATTTNVNISKFVDDN